MNDPKVTKSRPWGSIRSRRGRFYVVFHGDGRQYERGPFSTWKVADKMRNRARALIEGGTPVSEVLASCFGDFHGSTLTFRDAARLYLVEATKHKKASTLDRDTTRLAVLCAAPWAGKPLALVRHVELKDWIGRRLKGGASVATANRDLALGSALYRWAIECEYVEDNPFRRFKRFSERGRSREVYLTAVECDVLLAACSDVVRPLVLTAIHTGARQGQLLALEWRDVDFVRRVVRFRPEEDKTATGRDVPMTRALESSLLELHERKTVPLVGPHLVFRRGRKAWQRQTVLLHLRRAVTACGDDAPADRRLPESKRTDLRFHDLRHTTASLLAASGVPLFDIAKILGHRRIETTMRYAHFAPESGRKAIDGLDVALTTPTVPATVAKAGG
jgi:integrase